MTTAGRDLMPGIITVDELTGYISLLFDGNELLSALHVRGSLVDFKRHSSGHVYFSISGKKSRVSCVLFRSDAEKIPQWPRDGDEVLVEGRAGVYGPRGSYQIYARHLRPLGESAQARAKKELLQRLSGEGLFDPSVKRKLPAFPAKVAVVTSPTGAAVCDVVKVSLGRFPQCRLVVVPVMVQGAGSAGDVVRGLERAGGIPGIEAVMLVRGGGSREDLNPFDEEEVVRAVRKCPVPVITGLGHQVDRTLSDLASDVDAPTPSAAAEILFPSRSEIIRGLDSTRDRMARIVSASVVDGRSALDNYRNALGRAFERSGVRPAGDLLARLAERMYQAVCRETALSVSSLESAASSLDALSPLKVLSRGFASCSTPAGDLVSRVSEVSPGDDLVVRFRDGSLLAGIIEVRPD